MYKLLAIDIDGTIIDYERPHISDVVKDSVKRAKELGVYIVLISGRNYYSMKRFLEELEVEDYGITINGGIVTDLKTGEKLYEVYLEKSVARGVTEILSRKGVPYAVFAGLNAYAPREYEEHPTVQYLNLEKDNMIIYDDTDAFLNTIKTNKYIAMDTDEELDVLTEIIKDKFGDKVYVQYGLKGLIEIYPLDMNKGMALSNLANKLGIPMEEVMAIGDGENDISMIEAAGMGVAMGNAVKNVKEHADYVTKSIQEDGVAYAIEKLIINS